MRRFTRISPGEQQKALQSSEICHSLTQIPSRLPRVCGSYQVEHAAQHGQQQEGSLRVHAVDGSHHSGAGGRHAEDERPDGVQVKLMGQDTNTAVIHS